MTRFPSAKINAPSLRVLVVGLFALMIAFGVFWQSGLGRSQSRPDSAQDHSPSLYVKTIVVGEQSPPESFTRLSGVVQAKRESRLGFRRSGRVSVMSASEGDKVRCGDVLGRLDTADLEADRKRLQAELAGQTARLQELIRGPRPQTIAAAASEVKRLEAVLSAATLRLERQRLLNDRNAGSRQDLDDNQYAMDQATAALATAKAQHDELLEGTRVEVIEAQRAIVAGTEAMLERLSVDLRDSEIVAPYDGVVASRLVDEGTIVSVGESAFELFEAGSLEARFGLPSEWANRLRVGDSVDVESDRRVTQACVIRLHPHVDAVTRTRRMDVEVGATDDYVIGQVVTLRLKSDSTRDEGVWIPVTALSKGTRGLWSVFAVVTNKDVLNHTAGDTIATIERRDVRVLRTIEDQCCVTGMIARGERIVSDGVHRVSPGIEVSLEREERLALSSPDMHAPGTFLANDPRLDSVGRNVSPR